MYIRLCECDTATFLCCRYGGDPGHGDEVSRHVRVPGAQLQTGRGTVPTAHTHWRLLDMTCGLAV